MSDIQSVMTAVEGIEAKINAFAAKAEAEAKAAGSVSTDTKNAIDALGIKQRELADEIGRASCRERVCELVQISVVAVS